MGEQLKREKRPFFRLRGRTIEIFGRRMRLPASRPLRIAIGILFLLGGCFAILPVLGLWMLPLGLMVLSIDIAFIRRLRRRTEVWWSRRRRASKPLGPSGD